MAMDMQEYEGLKEKYQRQQRLYHQNQVYYCELRKLYKEMGEIYREYRDAYWYYWRVIVNGKNVPAKAETARQRLDEYVEELNHLREVITQKQQQIEAYQQTHKG